jgi:hypothetical protein
VTEVVLLICTATPLCVIVLKPGAETVMSYCPMGIEERRNDPSDPVVAVNVAPVALFFAFICAAWTADPVGSRTLPAILPSLLWPKASVVQHVNARNAIRD